MMTTKAGTWGRAEMTDWADQAAHYLVGDVAWGFTARWAAAMPADVADALRAASNAPRPSGTDKSAWQATSKKLVARLKGFMEPEEIETMRLLIVGGLAVASTRNFQAVPIEAWAISKAREIVLREGAALAGSITDRDEAAIEADSTLLGAAIAQAIIEGSMSPIAAGEK